MIDGIPPILREWCNDDLIAKDNREALVARLLITKAHDTVVNSLSPEFYSPTYSTPIRLTDFLVALVGEAHAKAVFDALPDNVPDPTKLIDSPLGNAKLNFTHWAQAKGDCAVTDEAAWIGLARNVGWECLDKQTGVDLITPLLLWDEDGKSTLSRYNVSAVLWQIRGRSGPRTVGLDAEKLRFFTRGSNDMVGAQRINSRPYLTIILNLCGVPLDYSSKANMDRPYVPARYSRISF
ncbi:hypothetical protein CTheo_9179 [Ceratobasidium theobromae]|uniref:Uncharacterized protein n=1 Tax=Ceratobasidium theobromae TaxID=1582974 RepID=A0A5N5Q632_9AGAM|nr:hypothetical protein CTheo_9179 [Ceratobasidium theobromae]